MKKSTSKIAIAVFAVSMTTIFTACGAAKETTETKPDHVAQDTATITTETEDDTDWIEDVYVKKCRCNTCGEYFDTKEEFTAHNHSHVPGGYSIEKVLVESIEH